MRVPDLWLHEEEAEAVRLYRIVIAAFEGKPEQRLELCRRIRRHAKAHGSEALVVSTLEGELEALFRLGRDRAAWQQLGRLERRLWGALQPPRPERWPADYAAQADRWRGPLLFARGRHEEAAAAFEAALTLQLERGASSYDLLPRVRNGDPEPLAADRVTLHHVYQRLGRALSRWSSWERFVRGFHDRLLELGGLRHGQLLEDPELLGDLVAILSEERRLRVTSGVTRGEADLVEDRSAVRDWQQGQAERLDRFRRETAGRRHELSAKLRHHFPDLDGR